MTWVANLLPAPGPLRPLALSTLLSRIANGVLMTVSVRYFNRGLGIAEIGLGLTIAGLVGLVSGIPMGHIADLRGPRTLFVLLSVGVAVVSLRYLAIGTRSGSSSPSPLWSRCSIEAPPQCGSHFRRSDHQLVGPPGPCPLWEFT